MEQETKMVFIAFASMTNYSNWKCQIALAANVSGLCVVALSRNLKLTTTLDRAITQNPCYVPLNYQYENRF